MARLFTSGAETGAREWNSTSGGLSIYVVAATTSYKRSGSYSWNCKSIGTTASATLREVFAANKTELYGRFALLISSDVTNRSIRIVSFHDGNNALQFYLRYDVGTATLEWRDGAGTLLAAGYVAVDADTWVVCEFYVDCASSGSLTLKVNGTTASTFSGDTDYTNYGSLRSITFGLEALSGGASGVLNLYLDDIAINDTDGSYQNSWVGLGGVWWLQPTADGTTNDWTPSAGSDNYAMVDDVPPNTSDYVQALDSGDLELYALEDCPEYVDRINLAQVLYRAALATSGSNDLTDVIRTGGANFDGDTHTVVPLIPSFTLYRGATHYVNPDTAAEWATAEIDALEAGFEIA